MFFLMVDNMRETMSKIKRKALASLNGLMVAYTKVLGKMESSMVWVFLLLLKMRGRKVNGSMEKKSDG